MAKQPKIGLLKFPVFQISYNFLMGNEKKAMRIGCFSFSIIPQGKILKFTNKPAF